MGKTAKGAEKRLTRASAPFSEPDRPSKAAISLGPNKAHAGVQKPNKSMKASHATAASAPIDSYFKQRKAGAPPAAGRPKSASDTAAKAALPPAVPVVGAKRSAAQAAAAPSRAASEPAKGRAFELDSWTRRFRDEDGRKVEQTFRAGDDLYLALGRCAPTPSVQL